jgi:hypothetical protein
LGSANGDRYTPAVPALPVAAGSMIFTERTNVTSVRSAWNGPIERLNVASAPPPPFAPASDRMMRKFRSSPSRISVACWKSTDGCRSFVNVSVDWARCASSGW